MNYFAYSSSRPALGGGGAGWPAVGCAGSVQSLHPLGQPPPSGACCPTGSPDVVGGPKECGGRTPFLGGSPGGPLIGPAWSSLSKGLDIFIIAIIARSPMQPEDFKQLLPMLSSF